MSHRAVADYDYPNQQCALEVYVGGSLVTTFTYSHATRRVTASSRSAVNLSVMDFHDLLVELDLWMSRTVDLWPVLGSGQLTTRHSVELEQKANGVEMTLKFKAPAPNVTVKAGWDQSTNLVTLNPRVALDLGWADFLLFHTAHRRMHELRLQVT